MSTSLTQLIQSAFGESQAPLPVTGRRRKKLWELPHRFHCPLVGTCLPVAEMRKFAARAGFDQADMSDYVLHTVSVGACESRTELAELIQRYFDKRHAALVQRFARAKGESAVLALWQEALAAGNDIAGALWAAWSHPDLAEENSKRIYSDLHMLSHQTGAAVRADLRQLEQVKLDNARLRDEAQALRAGMNELQRERERELADLHRRLTEAEQRASQLAHRELELASARQSARDYDNLYSRAEAMTRRIETLEERNALNARRAHEYQLRAGDLQAELGAAEAALELALGIDGIAGCAGVAGSSGCGRSCPAEAALAGRCVLCIGGKTNLVDGYRRLVETRGGRFLHHDGGQEENLHRIDAAVASADAVVCQAGCVSHAAYYRLKDACKKLGKPCVFVQSPGVTSFARSLSALSQSPVLEQASRLSN